MDDGGIQKELNKRQLHVILRNLYFKERSILREKVQRLKSRLKN